MGLWQAGRGTARHGTDHLVHLFTDTRYEDDDLYRFLPQAAENIGGRLVQVAEGRSVWELFHDRRVIGNNRLALCSETLKQKQARKYLEENCDPAETTLYVGILWYEKQRMDKKGGIRERWLPWRVEAPLCEPPYLTRPEILAWLEREGLDPPSAYDEGLSNNCGGRCVRMGQAGWRQLLLLKRERFLEVEAKEEEMRRYLDKDVAILKDRRGGTTKPLPLVELRRRIEAGEGCNLLDWGKGCECMFAEEGQPEEQ